MDDFQTFFNENKYTFLSILTTSAMTFAAILYLNRQRSSKVLDSTAFKPFKLIKKTVINHNTRIFRFELPPTEVLGLPVGQHIQLMAKVDGRDVVRSFTPIQCDAPGHFDLLVKIYFKDVNPRFPKGGLLTQHLEQLSVGDVVMMKGPVGRFEYTGPGEYTIARGGRNVPPTRFSGVTHISMIAGGTGITPMWQVLDAVLKNPNDKTQVTLVYSNHSEADILMREELDRCSNDRRFRVFHTLSVCPEGWTGGRGHISFEMLQEHIEPPKGAAHIVLLCGPPTMISQACKPNLEKLGYAQEHIFTF